MKWMYLSRRLWRNIGTVVLFLFFALLIWQWAGPLAVDVSPTASRPVVHLDEGATPLSSPITPHTGTPQTLIPTSRFTLLVFSKTAGYRHPSISAGKELLQTLATDHAFTVQFSEDATIFTDAALADFDGVLFLNTTGDFLNDEQQAAFERFIRKGKGFIGVHAASDAEYEWAWYGDLLGAYFSHHPTLQDATVNVVDELHPSTTGLPDPWSRFDEWYNFRSQPKNVTVLLTVDEESYSGGSMGENHPIAWYHLYDGGRSWYTAMGHTAESYQEPFFQQHLLGGIKWAMGEEAITESGRVTEFVLINAELDEELFTLTDGATIDLATLPTDALNLRAKTVPARVGSLQFSLNENPYFAIEHLAPYALAGDARGDMMPWALPTGRYTLTATPYSGAHLTATAGVTHTIAFSLVNSKLAKHTGGAVHGTESLPTATAALNGVLYLDENLNQQADVGEPALAGISLAVVRLDNPAANPAVDQRTVVTDEAGYFLVDDLPAGHYQISPLLPESLQALRPTAGLLTLLAESRTEVPDFMIRDRSDTHFTFLPTIYIALSFDE